MGKILVIDDEENIREILKEMLEIDGHEVIVATNGKEGLNATNANHFDVVITDIFMPEEDGIEIIMKMKKNDPGMKIIAISGGGYFDPAGSLKTAELLGAKYTINKPFDMQDLLSKVNSLL